MTRSQQLVQTLSRSGAVSAAAIILAAALFGSGCGVKTAPRADIDNLRPSIPFKTAVTSPSPDKAKDRKTKQNTSKKAKKANSP